MLLLLTLACSSSPEPTALAPGQAAAPTEVSATAAAPAKAQPLPDGTHVVDVAVSKLLFVPAKITRSHDCGFTEYAGTVRVDGGQPTALDFTIELKSVFTDVEKLTSHLLSPDFFDVETYPQATFRTSAIAAGGEGGTHTVTGTLDLHGKSNEITFPATFGLSGGAVRMTADFDIDRQLWGVAYPGRPDDLIKDKVGIKLELSFPGA